ncbi:hypothetical protein [Thermoactinomyces mirandus]|uniref:hypothetical protein n=1 Tax=Thermoactinomyces mirandus TaxID=2756294 RepID=UPI0015EF0DEF|nr:hypothetical protein [Thermoactinomyces mirandus]
MDFVFVRDSLVESFRFISIRFLMLTSVIDKIPECFYRTFGEVLASLIHILVKQAAEAGIAVQTSEEAKQV